MDQSILLAQEVKYVETETDQMNNMRGPITDKGKDPDSFQKRISRMTASGKM